MRFLHTADWHLGRPFHNASLLDDQAHVLDQLVTLARESAVDAVIVAGDVYDRSVPPAEAVSLLNETLERLAREAGAAVVLIAGNHDGAERLGFGARFLAEAGLHVFGPLSHARGPVGFEDADGPVFVCPMPYADPAAVRLHLGDEEIRSHAAAVEAQARAIRSAVPGGARAIAVGHCWVTGGSDSESERPLTVGGTGEVPADCFGGFAYTALGHLHRPQTIGERIHYSGSLLKYSFSEVDHRKSVALVELDGSGTARVERVELTPRRDVRVVEGSLKELLAGAGREGGGDDDYLLVRLTDRQALLDPVGKLRAIHPNVLHLERTGLGTATGDVASGRERLKLSERELFTSFFEEVTGDGLLEGGAEAFAAVVDDLRRLEREDADPAPKGGAR